MKSVWYWEIKGNTAIVNCKKAFSRWALVSFLNERCRRIVGGVSQIVIVSLVRQETKSQVRRNTTVKSSTLLFMKWTVFFCYRPTYSIFLYKIQFLLYHTLFCLFKNRVRRRSSLEKMQTTRKQNKQKLVDLKINN